MAGSQPIERRVEAVLRDAYGVRVEVTRAERVEPWFVSRCHLAPTAPGFPRSVIAKWLRENPDGVRTDPRQLETERAALEFLDELGVGLAPRLVGCDARTLVLEDVAPRVALSDILRAGDEPAGTVGLHAFARTLGELHAATHDAGDAYYARRRAIGPVDPRHDRRAFMGRGWPGYLDTLGFPMNDPARAEMSRVIDVLDEPGAFLSFSNGDAGANNFFVDGSDGRLIDFEFAGYRHAAVDVVCFYVPGPAWIAVGDPVTSGLEATYRRALGGAVPEAFDDERFGFGVAAACIAFAVERLRRVTKLDSRPPGEPSRLQQVSTMESAARTADAHGALPHLAAWARRTGAALRKRWPDADVDLSAYRAYAPRG